MEDPIIRVALSLTDFDCPSEAISHALKLVPTKTWQKGDRIGTSKRLHPETGWMFEPPMRDSLDLEDHVMSLLSRVPANLEALRRVVGQCQVEITCTVSIKHQTPAMNFSPVTLGRIASLGATLDVDLYLIE